MKSNSKKTKNIQRYLGLQRLIESEIQISINPDVQFCIVIPSYNEPELLVTLDSLAACDGSNTNFEVIIVLNSSENCDKKIQDFHRQQQKQILSTPYPFEVIPLLIEDIPAKKAGVGYARKTGMDFALSRLAIFHPEDGVMICLDGDCLVQSNYMAAIQEYFNLETAKHAIHLNFEHPFPSDISLRNSIIQYEMHLRLMKLQLQAAGHPQAFHAVGSCLAVRAWAYAAQGGMNSRQAGEDFYFIHKFSKIGQLDELLTTTVIPSSRESSRVPFGTGAAVKKAMNANKQFSYHPKSYEQIKRVISGIPSFYVGDYASGEYFEGFKADEFTSKMDEIRKHTKSPEAFRQRFFYWFDAFQVIKFLHHLRELHYEDLEVDDVSLMYLISLTSAPPPNDTAKKLMLLRQIDRQMSETRI